MPGVLDVPAQEIGEGEILGELLFEWETYVSSLQSSYLLDIQELNHTNGRAKKPNFLYTNGQGGYFMIMAPSDMPLFGRNSPARKAVKQFPC